jgi:hypothetical protein
MNFKWMFRVIFGLHFYGIVLSMSAELAIGFSLYCVAATTQLMLVLC